MVINFSLCGKLFGRPELINLARHGLEFVEEVHWDAERRLYAFSLQDNKPVDMTQQSYAYAFVLNMQACCQIAGIRSDGKAVAQVFDLMEERFWLPDLGAYADEISPDGVLSNYRGQNSNMHICEALIVAYEATHEQRYLDRATVLAETFCQRQAKLGGGMIWEHYTKTFEIDWDYNKDDPQNLYRPWGFQPGHQSEWAKNLCNICRFAPEEWMLEKAKALFDRAWDLAWDHEHGGLLYSFSPDGKCVDDMKYHWTNAESIAAAAQLYQATGDSKYLNRYNALWDYCWNHMVDHKYGAWYRLLHRDNSKVTNEKSVSGAKCDYHTIVSCLEALRQMK